MGCTKDCHYVLSLTPQTMSTHCRKQCNEWQYKICFNWSFRI